MRIAIASENDCVAPHFGRCSEFVIFDVEGTEVTGKEVAPAPEHEPGRFPAYLAERGVARVIAGGMGPRAQQLFERQGIRSVIGAQGPVDQVIRAYLTGQLQVGDSACDHPHGEHAGGCHEEG